MFTLKELIDSHSVDVDEHLSREATVPVLTGLQRQGDVIVIPATEAKDAPAKAALVGPQGVAVVRGEAGGNTHLLLPVGEVFYTPADTIRSNGVQLKLGTLTVPAGSEAYLAHPEHGYMGVGPGPGTYTISRQREQADEIRMVAD